MNSKAIARIVPINDDGDGRLPFYARTVIETIGGFEGVGIDGSGYACNKAWWKIEMLPPEWNGEGLPPVGIKCEHCPGGTTNHNWEVVTVAGVVVNLVTGFTDYWLVKEDGSSYTIGNPYRFRPIRSERDKVIDALSLVILESHADDDEYMNTETYIYDAIAAGKIPGIKLED